MQEHATYEALALGPLSVFWGGTGGRRLECASNDAACEENVGVGVGVVCLAGDVAARGRDA